MRNVVMTAAAERAHRRPLCETADALCACVEGSDEFLSAQIVIALMCACARECGSADCSLSNATCAPADSVQPAETGV